MNSLDLTKDPEIVPSEVTETVETVETVDTVDTLETSLETVVIEQPEETNTIVADYAASSKQELIDALKLLIDKEVDAAKDGVEQIKQLFYKKVKLDVEEQKKLFIENGGIETDFVSAKDELEESFKALLNEFRVKKASVMAQLEKEKDSNLLQKQHLLEQMKVLVASNDDVSTHINEFRALQQKWKSIGQVPQTASTELWKQYNLYQESFWDLIKINNELREYDFKKNLESKTLLCDAAEKLSEETDVIAAFQKLQKLHEEWHELGPVAREIREQIWTRFKDASTAIHKKHQSYFDSIRKLEEENLVTKTELCEKIEAFDYSKLNNYRQWDEATKTILAWQEEWRSIGFAPRKVNQKVFDRYRKACDAFFAAKGEFYKETKNVLVVNSDKKKALCEQAEALKDSTDWKEAGEKFILLQKEWKTIGPVAKKYSDELWKRFIAACDYFFEQKNKSTSGQRNAESENLAKKKELIAKINAFQKSENNNESVATLRALMAEWNTIGHVPFKEKDKVYKEYRDAVDKQFETLNVDATNRRMDNFRSNLKDMSGKGENKLYREREKLMRAYEHLKSEILTYENNIGFFSSSSKKGGGLIKEMERKIESLKEESKLIEQKINLIDENI
jgi:DNA-binding HxlR family transcriptional regulator